MYKSLKYTDAGHLRSAVQAWQARGSTSECPDISRLITEGLIDDAWRGEDPWGEKYQIACTGDDVSVRSYGPDRVPETEDDIIVGGET